MQCTEHTQDRDRWQHLGIRVGQQTINPVKINPVKIGADKHTKPGKRS